MSKRIAINLKKYGDFDIPINTGVLLAPEGMSKTEINKIASKIETDNKNTNNTSTAFAMFKHYGFISCNTIDCTIGKNL